MRFNEGIKAKEVRLIDETGKQIGVVPTREAIIMAKDKGYDLVEVAGNIAPPVCKIMDFGKYKYQLSKKHSSRKTVDVKEIKIRPQINDHDLQLKVKSIRRFLDEGDKAKVTMMFRGREVVRPEIGMRVFQKLTEMLEGKFTIEQQPKFEGNHITMVIAPSNK
ncbi:MAG: translation initiation factor IF-3 [Thermodesulfovibrionales bacterium]|nr:translation initiation factor IF-3 [Thermodesulfovibrionales bacterium]